MGKKKSAPAQPPLLHRAPHWQRPLSTFVELWHGCLDLDRIIIEKNGVDWTLGKINSDFGRGFYTTTIRRQAEQWAWRRHFDQRRKSPPVVLRFLIRRHHLADRAQLSFVCGDFDNEEFWSFVQHCRQSTQSALNDHDGPNQGWYDVVSGPVAAMWRQRITMVGADQVGFHTKFAADLLSDAIGDPQRYAYFAVI